MSFLTLTDVAKSYGATRAVIDMNLSVEKGEFVSLLGPSGCGKTTTLQMIAGFAEVSAGRINLDGRDITHAKPNTRGLGIVFQSYALFPHMTVSDNVSFGLEMKKVPKAERRERVEAVLALVHLEPFAQRYPREVSGGQRQRVALARALLAESGAILMDDPLSAVDTETERTLLQTVGPALRGRTVLVATQRLSTVALADRAVVLRDGKLVEQGTPAELAALGGDFTALFGDETRAA